MFYKEKMILMFDAKMSLSAKLHQTGWQSWSVNTEADAIIKLLTFNYPPKGENRSITVSKSGILKKPAHGWCSWYCYGSNINEEKILDNARWVASDKQLSLNYILVDGGWARWGDWLEEDRNKFPNGMKPLSMAIKKMGLKPGIWTSPFLVDPQSNLARKHPDWLVRKKGRLIDGFKLTPFDKFFFYRKWILDIKNNSVLDYLNDCIARLVEERGFELLKLDFLYAIYFDPRLSTLEADSFFRSFLLRIKLKYPNVYTIASGCPLVPAVGVVDSMRIGPDTVLGPFFNFLPIMKLFDRYHLQESVMGRIRRRLWTKSLWNIDPDAFVCRDSLGFPEKLILNFSQFINEAGGNIFLGDDLTKLSPERIEKYVLPLFNK